MMKPGATIEIIEEGMIRSMAMRCISNSKPSCRCDLPRTATLVYGAPARTDAMAVGQHAGRLEGSFKSAGDAQSRHRPRV